MLSKADPFADMRKTAPIAELVKRDNVFFQPTLSCDTADTHCIYGSDNVLLSGADDGSPTPCAEITDPWGKGFSESC
jgi:hypothetical protein